jgi:A/G-specific adenine glycosylase
MPSGSRGDAPADNRQTILPRYRPFLRRFPTIRRSREHIWTTFAAWSGLGYYARARNLHRAANLVVERHGGRRLTISRLRALPG